MSAVPDADADPEERRRLFVALGRSQDGVVSRAQAREHVVTRHVVRSAVRAGRWRAHGPRVVVLHTGPLTQRQRWWVAVLPAGPRAALCGLSALQAEGLRGYEPDRVQVVVPHGAEVPRLPGVRVVESRDLRGAVHPTRRPARTRPSRSVVDAAAFVRDDLRACAILAATVQQGLVRPADVRAEVERRPTLPRRARLLAVLDDLTIGARSLSEVDALRLCRRFRLPIPGCQVRVEQRGSRRYLDLHWEALPGHGGDRRRAAPRGVGVVGGHGPAERGRAGDGRHRAALPGPRGAA